MLISEFVNVKVISKTMKHYKSLGYECKKNEIIKIPVEHLSIGSHVKVKVQCDICNKIIEKVYKTYLKEREKYGIDNCFDCRQAETIMTNNIKYGVDNVFEVKEFQDKQKNTVLINYNVENISQLEEVKNKKRATFLDRYGVDNPMHCEEFKEKGKETCMQKYGVEHYNKTEEAKQRIRDTCTEKYGVPNPLQNDTIKQKVADTCLERYGADNYFKTDEFDVKRKKTNILKYGVEYYSQSEDFKIKYKKASLKKFGTEHPLKNKFVMKKINETLCKNGTCKTSSQQLEVFNMLKSVYNDNIFLNYVCDNCIFDMALFIGNIKIDIEYDGWYWHRDQNRDKRRDYYFRNRGWKILRIKSGCKIPSLSVLIDNINELVTIDKNHINIILDDWKEGDFV